MALFTFGVDGVVSIHFSKLNQSFITYQPKYTSVCLLEVKFWKIWTCFIPQQDFKLITHLHLITSSLIFLNTCTQIWPPQEMGASTS
jgi:hypothetical protein